MAITIAVVLLVAHALHLLIHYRRCAEGYVRLVPMPVAGRPSVSVIIPARNEARDLGGTLESLLRQQGVDLEVLIVDDHSVDDTAAIAQRYAAADARVRFLSAPLLPSGWCGKPHAQAHGAAHARHRLLLFVDADVRFAPTAVASAVAALMNREVDLVTLLPKAELGSFWERAVQPVMAAVIFYGVSFARVNDPSNPQSVGIGAFVLVRRSVYDAAGGHTAIRDRIVDDYALAQAVKQAGGRLWLADGRDAVSIRMYHSLAEIWRGWSKNLYEGLKLPVWIWLGGRDRYVLPNRPLVVLGLLLGYLLATFVVPMILPLWAAMTSSDPVIIAAVWGLFAVFFAAWAVLCRTVEISPRWALILPLGALVVAAIALSSAWSARFGRGLAWRGRRYRVAR